MKKLLTIYVLFIAAALMVVGCDEKKDNDKDLLSLAVMAGNALPPTEAMGSAQDVSSASSATFATATAMSQVRMAGNPGTPMMQSLMVNSNNPDVNDGLKKSIIDAVNANAVDKMKDVYAGCNGSETVNVNMTTAITGTGYSVTPDVHVTGSFNCNGSDGASGSFDVAIQVTGSVTAAFTDMHVQVFDIQNYINNHTFVFKDVVVNGTVTISNVNVTTNVSFDYSVLPLPSLKLVAKNTNEVTISSNLQIDGNPPVALDLNVVEKFSFRLSLFGMSGSISTIAEGTVGANPVSFSYGFNGDNIFEFQTYVTDQIGYGI